MESSKHYPLYARNKDLDWCMDLTFWTAVKHLQRCQQMEIVEGEECGGPLEDIGEVGVCAVSGSQGSTNL